MVVEHIQLFIDGPDYTPHLVTWLTAIEGEICENGKFTATFALDADCKGQALLRNSHPDSLKTGRIQYNDAPKESYSPSRRRFFISKIEYKELLSDKPSPRCQATITVDDFVAYFNPRPLKCSKRKAPKKKRGKRK